MNKPAFRDALTRSLPVLCSYLFIGTAFGIMMNEAGYGWPLSALSSVVIYTGAFQFVLVALLAASSPLGTIALTALLMSCRQVFYSLTFIDEFRCMGRRMPYMIASMTDETYALNCSLPPDLENREDVMFYLAILCQVYWVAGTLLGAIAGNVIPWDMTGIDFCMTALFIIIFIDHWEKNPRHFPATAGAVIAVICLLIFGAGSFMLPALLMTSAALLIWDSVRHRRDEASEEMP